MLAVFTVAWAVAALFHLWLTPRLASLLSAPSWVALSHLGIAGGAVWALLHPSRPAPLIALALVEVWSVYLEAPVLGNHWLVIGLVDLVLLAGGIDTYLRRRLVPAALSAVTLPAARWTLLAFYTCAAFAKVNSGFLDPAVSCATYFTREAATSWGLDLPAVDR